MSYCIPSDVWAKGSAFGPRQRGNDIPENDINDAIEFAENEVKAIIHLRFNISDIDDSDINNVPHTIRQLTAYIAARYLMSNMLGNIDSNQKIIDTFTRIIKNYKQQIAQGLILKPDGSEMKSYNPVYINNSLGIVGNIDEFYKNYN